MGLTTLAQGCTAPDEPLAWRFGLVGTYNQQNEVERIEKREKIFISPAGIGSRPHRQVRYTVACALLDRLMHHVHILELNGESYRLKQSTARRRRAAQTANEKAAAADPETGEITPAS